MNHPNFTSLRFCTAVLLASALAQAGGARGWAETYELTPDSDWFAVIHGDELRPGDEVLLHEGVYRDPRRLAIGHRGTPQRPVVIRAAKGERAVLQRPDARQNTINIEGAQYLTLRGIEITGGAAGIRMNKSSRYACKFVTLENLHIHHVGGVAVTANQPGNQYEGMVFRGNHIHHTDGHGEGFYLGVNNNADGSTAGYLFNSLIEGNYIHDLKGPGVSQGDGIEIKDGSFNNVVRNNVIHDTSYPGIIVYGTDGKSPNIVERNLIWRAGDHGIQAAADAIIRNNVVFDCRADGIYSRAHQSAVVGNLQVVHNTVIASRPRTACIRIAVSNSETRLTGPVVIANNALYAKASCFALRVPSKTSLLRDISLAGNVGVGPTEGFPQTVARNVWNPTGDLARDLDGDDGWYPLSGAAVIGAADPQFRVTADFNGTARETSRDAGAYHFDLQGNPGKPLHPAMPPLPRFGE
jgi:parallel beta-helix repeat protein